MKKVIVNSSPFTLMNDGCHFDYLRSCSDHEKRSQMYHVIFDDSMNHIRMTDFKWMY